MYRIDVIGQHANRTNDHCNRCKLYADAGREAGCHHTRDVANVAVRGSESRYKVLDIIAPEQLAALARWTNAQESRNRKAMQKVGGR